MSVKCEQWGLCCSIFCRIRLTGNVRQCSQTVFHVLASRTFFSFAACLGALVIPLAYSLFSQRCVTLWEVSESLVRVLLFNAKREWWLFVIWCPQLQFWSSSRVNGGADSWHPWWKVPPRLRTWIMYATPRRQMLNYQSISTERGSISSVP